MHLAIFSNLHPCSNIYIYHIYIHHLKQNYASLTRHNLIMLYMYYRNMAGRQRGVSGRRYQRVRVPLDPGSLEECSTPWAPTDLPGERSRSSLH